MTLAEWRDRWSSDAASRASIDNEFCELALSEYMERAVDKMNKLNSIVAEIVTWEPTNNSSPFWDRELTNTEADEIAADIISRYELDADSCVVLKSGNFHLKDIARDLLQRYHKYQNAIDSTGSASAITEEHVLYARNIVDGTSIPIDGCVCSSIVDEIQDNLASTVALFSAIYARAKSAASGTAAMLTTYKDKISEVYSSVSGKISNTVNFFKPLLNEAVSTSQALNWIFQTTDLNRSDSSSGLWTPSSSEVALYTGATPVSGIVLQAQGMLTLLAAPFVAAYQFVKSIFSTVKTAILNFATKVGKTVIQNTVYPVSVARAWDDGHNIVDKYYSITGGQVVAYVPGGLCSDATVPSQQERQTAANAELSGNWYKLDTIFSQSLIQFGEFYNAGDGVVLSDTMTDTTSMSSDKTKHLIKPKILNPDVVAQLWPVSGGTTQPITTFAQLKTFIEACFSVGDDLYFTGTMSDTDTRDVNALFLEGYRMGYVYAHFLGMYSWYILAGVTTLNANLPLDMPGPGSRIIKSFSKDHNSTATALFTNKDIFNLITGYDYLNPGLNRFCISGMYAWDSDDLYFYETLSNGLGGYYPTIIAASVIAGSLVPDQLVFYPYLHYEPNWSPANWVLKSDDTIIQEASLFWTKVVVAAITIAVTVSVSVAVGAISRRLYINKVRALGMMDNAMWNGETLTGAETLRYIRLQRKLNGGYSAVSSLSGFDSLVGTVGTLNSNGYNTTTQVVEKTEEVGRLIKANF